MGQTIEEVLSELRAAATSSRDLGDRFERLMAEYLRLDPLYAERFSEVWLWQDWPGRSGVADTGIDLVAAERDGGVCAIQCKFYDPSRTLDRKDIDSFFTVSGRPPFTSRLIVSTTDRWSAHAEKALVGQTIPVGRLRVADLAESPIDWSRFTGSNPQAIALRRRHDLRPHQAAALDDVVAGLAEGDRGTLVMACGTGKTFTSLRIAERIAAQVPDRAGRVLFLVPSISLLSQTLREWSAQTAVAMHAFAVCSDTRVSRTSEDIAGHDLALPATTDPARLVERVTAVEAGSAPGGMTVVFSTYQSIATIHDAQRAGLGDFDLVICDEAHRTTGVTLAEGDESHFVRVHDADYLRAAKRLYMTATPRLFDDATKTKAGEASAVLCSMDDPELFGAELHRLGFGDAVGAGLLTDYRVMVLAVSEEYVAGAFQRQLAADSELRLEDAVKIVGCWNGLTHRGHSPEGVEDEQRPDPMRRAVAFCRDIKSSKHLTEMFNRLVPALAADDDATDPPGCDAHHVDGTFNALQRNAELDWLKRDPPPSENMVRILSNARCLSEGVDVPALDAVMFLNPRSSVVDVVQSVGRVMRRAEGKDYGYIILPIGVPADMSPEQALADNRRYRVVWQVLQALRAHDDRFNATINKIDLNAKRPASIQVVGVPGAGWGDGDGGGADGTGTQIALPLGDLEQWRDAIYARIVQKCGDRLYWENWATDIAQIAERHTARIRAILDDSASPGAAAFQGFLADLRRDLNPAVGRDDAIEMLSQHLITKPVFDALFEAYAFAEHNPVSQTMQRMLSALGGESLDSETDTLERFYESVRLRAVGVDSDLGRQRIITELYERFFKAAFPKMAERLGIVYTPIEIVDFIIESVQSVLRDEFGSDLGAPGVHILDPFTGTGTFMVRLLQSRLVDDDALPHKFRHELHANEIVLLAYYIAAINIEAAFHARMGGEYEPFPGIVLTDTFQLAEKPTEIDAHLNPANHERVENQQAQEITVILGNPPYSVGQTSQNDGNVNLAYPALDAVIGDTYARRSSAVQLRNLYDSYVRAIRWASDRIGRRGVVAFVTNGYFVDGASQDGLRKSLVDEFTTVYCLNLRGNQRGTQGDASRREGGKIFGSGSRAPVAITVLVRTDEPPDRALHYLDIGDYLTRDQKLTRLRDFGGVAGVPWTKITPDDSGDWINKRDSAYSRLPPLGDRGPNRTPTFGMHSLGLATNRDAWVYNFDRRALESAVATTIAAFNDQARAFIASPTDRVDEFIDRDPRMISWSRGLKHRLTRTDGELVFDPGSVTVGSYRPFCKQWLYFHRDLNETVSQQPRIYPAPGVANLSIAVTGVGARREFSALMVSAIPDLETLEKAQTFPRYVYDLEAEGSLLPERTHNVTDATLTAYRRFHADDSITKDDIFFHVYGVLHHPTYRERYAAELRKMLPRLPMVADFHAYAAAGRALSDLHVGYESVEPYQLEEIDLGDASLPGAERYRVQKMRFRAKGDRGAIVYNAHLTVAGIPERAYDYVVNGRPAIEWIIDRYQVRTDKSSGIINDPNAYSDDPRYIVDLLRRIVTVSLGTLDIVEQLPTFEIVAR